MGMGMGKNGSGVGQHGGGVAIAWGRMAWGWGSMGPGVGSLGVEQHGHEARVGSMGCVGRFRVGGVGQQFST